MHSVFTSFEFDKGYVPLWSVQVLL